MKRYHVFFMIIAVILIFIPVFFLVQPEMRNDTMHMGIADQMKGDMIDMKIFPDVWTDVQVEYYGASADDGKITVSLPPGVTLNPEYKAVVFGPDPGKAYGSVSLLEYGRSTTGALSDDLQYLFYIQITETDDSTTFTFIRADVHNKEVSVLDSFTVEQDVAEIAIRSMGSPHIVGNYFDRGYIAYNWFARSPAPSETKDYIFYDYFVGVVRDIASVDLLWKNDCSGRITEFNFDISVDGSTLISQCDKDFWITRIESGLGESDKIQFPENVKPVRVSFVEEEGDQGNNRIRFVDGSEDVGGCLAPQYSMLSNGDELERLENAYMCF